MPQDIVQKFLGELLRPKVAHLTLQSSVSQLLSQSYDYPQGTKATTFLDTLHHRISPHLDDSIGLDRHGEEKNLHDLDIKCPHLVPSR